MISAPSSQPGRELVSCWQVKTSLKRHRLLNKENSMGGGEGGREGSLFLEKPYSQVLLSVWEAERELGGGGMGRQAETATEEEREGRNK